MNLERKMMFVRFVVDFFYEMNVGRVLFIRAELGGFGFKFDFVILMMICAVLDLK